MSRVRILQLVSTVLVAALLIGALPPAAASIPSPTGPAADPLAAALVSVEAPASPVPVGQTFSVSIAVSGLEAPLGAFQFDLAFDPTILELTEASGGPFLSSTGRMMVCPGAIQAGGTVRLACASAGAAEGASGGGTLAVLTFRAWQEGESDLLLSGLQLPDDGRPPALIPATWQDGQVTVGQGDNYPVYLPLVVKNHPSTGVAAETVRPETWAMPLSPSLDSLGPAATSRPYPSLDRAAPAFGNGYWADLDGDQDVDLIDLQIAAGSWNCSLGQPCYDAAHDRDGDGDIDALDLAHFGNEYDVEPPAITITNPAEGSAVGTVPLVVSGTVTDTHAIASVTVNGVSALVTGDAFEAQVPLVPGNQVLTVVAEDEVGATGTAERIVGLDDEGPQIDVITPRNRQSVYTLAPALEIHYQDYYSAVDTGSLSILLKTAGSSPLDVTGDLAVEADRAYGTVSSPLQEDASYTMTVSLQDTFANESVVQTSFYVPLGAEGITPPGEAPDAGWLSGVIYDANTCDEHLTQCQGLAGVQVTLARVDGAALQSARAARQAEIEARLASSEAFVPLGPPWDLEVTTPLSGTVITGPDGFFAFPVASTDRYWLRAEKETYTYGQREAEIVKERSTATNAIYLTPLDLAETPCQSDGCSHTSADGLVQVDIPAGAIPAGEVLTTTATNFSHVEFLPSGELPPDTQETYAFNLGGDSEYQFQEPVTVRIQNSLGFAPGTEIPLGYWNAETMAWEHAGSGVVDASGGWVEMEVTHFSNYDCNDPVTKGGSGGEGDGDDGDDPGCGGSEGGSIVMLRSGHLREEIELPPVSVLGDDVAPRLLYNSSRASPSQVIDVALTVAPEQGVTLLGHIRYELYIEGQKTDSFYVANAIQNGETGRYRYLWDGRDAQGRRLPPGVYGYRVELGIPYRAQYCYALGGIFGNPPDCVNGATGQFVDTEDIVAVEGHVDGLEESPLGQGWVLEGVQRLYEDEAGRVLVADGEFPVEFYSPGKDLLTAYYAGGGGTAQGASESLPALEAGNPAGEPPAAEPPPASAPEAGPDAPAPLSLTLLDDSGEPAAQMPYYVVNGEVGGQIISDTTWTVSGSPYTVTSDVTVMDGVTLTVEPGVAVVFQANTGLSAQGNLVAVGTYTNPITFTGAVSNTPGYWDTLFIGGGADLGDSDASRLSYVTVEGAGRGSQHGLTIDRCTPALDHLTLRQHDGHGLYGSSAGPFSLHTATIEDNSGHGINLVSHDGGQVLTGLTVQRNGGSGLYLSLVNEGWITVTGATVADNGGYGFEVMDFRADLVLRDSLITGNDVAARLTPDSQLESNTWSGNARNEIEWLADTITGDRTWSQRSGGLDTYRIIQDVTAADGVTLTVEPGVAVVFEAYAGLWVRGNLAAVGTFTEPITFTGAVSNTPGYWDTLSIGGGTDLGDSDASRLSYVTVEGAGRGSQHGLTIDRCTPALDHLTLRQHDGHGLNGYSAGPFSLHTATIEDNSGDGIHLGGSDGGQVLTDLTVQNNSGHGLYLAHSGWITVTDSTLAGNEGHGIQAMDYRADLVLRDSLITGNDVAARLAANSRLENNLWLRNRLSRIEWHADTIHSERHWPVAPYGPDNYLLLGTVTVDDGARLTLEAGAALDFATPASLQVNGALVAVGTIDQPITFDLGLGQVRIGGGSVLTDSAGTHLSFAVIKGGGNGDASLHVDRCTPALDHLTIHDSLGHGLLVSNGENLEVTISNFYDNADHGIFNSTPTKVVTATYNYWGAATGPYHPTLNPDGAGNPVSDGVIFEPWLRQPILEMGIVNNTPWDNTELSWDPDTDTYTRRYPDGRQVHFQPDGYHDYTLDRSGTRTAFAYHPDGLLATMSVIPAGESLPRWTWTFDYAGGRLAAITDPAGRVTYFAVDAHNHLTTVTFPGGESRAFAYDDRGLMTQQTDQNGGVTTYSFDDYGRIERLAYPWREVYDPGTGQVELAQEIKEFAPGDTAYPLLNDASTGSPDTPGPAAPGSDDLVSAVDYARGGRSGHLNRWGYWLDETDGLGRTTAYQRDERNRLTRETLPGGDCVEYSYDANDNMLSEAHMDAAQCALDPGDRDPAQVQTWTYTYEERFNQVKTETDPLGHTTTHVYDYEEGVGEAGHLIRTEYPPVENEDGVTVTPTVQYTYNGWGLLESETDERGTVTRTIYTQGTPDEAYGQPGALFAEGVTPVPGLLSQEIRDYGDETHLNQTTTSRDFDAAGNPMTVLGPGWAGGGAAVASCSTCAAGGGGLSDEGTVTHATYDAWGRVLTEENALGIVTRYTYDGRGNLIEEIADYTPDGTTGRNVVTTYTYNSHHQLLSQRTAADAIVQEMVYVYDINRKLATLTDGNGNTRVYSYDDADQLVAATDPLGHTTTFSYTPKGERTGVTQPDGDITRTLYDPFGRPVQEIVDEGGLNLSSSASYDLAGNLIAETDAEGTVTCYAYDARNRLVSETRDCGGLDLTTTYAYDVGGNLVHTTDERGVITTEAYDALGRLTSTCLDAGGLNLETTYAYDGAGNQSSSTDERGTVTSYEYDALNRVTAMHKDAGGLDLTTTYSYDRLGNETARIEPDGTVHLSEHNAFGQPVREVDDVGGLAAETRTTYDNNLNLLAISDANGNTTGYSTNGRDQYTQILYADGSTIDFGYHPDGTLAWRVDQADNRVDYGYDGADRLTGKSYPDGSSQSFGYDDAGRQTSAAQTMSGHTSQASFAYNALGDLTSSTQTLDGLSWTTGYGTDYTAGITTISYPSGAQVTETWDALNWLSQVARDGAPVAGYTYDEAAGTMTLAHANGVTTQVETDPLWRISRVSSTGPSGTMADYRYGYDQADNPIYLQRWHESGHPADVYQYDGLSQLTQVWYGADATDPGAIGSYQQLQWYDLDTLGNRLEVQNDGASEIYLPNDGVRLTNPMNRYEQVDSRPFAYDARGNLQDDGVNVYTYDYESRQTWMTGPGGTAEYVYDALGRRLAKVMGGVPTFYVYDDRSQVIEERDDGDQLLARTTYGADIDEPLSMERNGQTYTYHRDGLGSVTEVTDAAGALVERTTYDVYGAPRMFDGAGTPQPASAIGNPYLFTGRRYDPESGNYFYRARIYSPAEGRFLQMDPAEYTDDLNAYRYVKNRPASDTDPTGMRPKKKPRDPCRSCKQNCYTKRRCWKRCNEKFQKCRKKCKKKCASKHPSCRKERRNCRFDCESECLGEEGNCLWFCRTKCEYKCKNKCEPGGSGGSED